MVVEAAQKRREKGRRQLSHTCSTNFKIREKRWIFSKTVKIVVLKNSSNLLWKRCLYLLSVLRKQNITSEKYAYKICEKNPWKYFLIDKTSNILICKLSQKNQEKIREIMNIFTNFSDVTNQLFDKTITEKLRKMKI